MKFENISNFDNTINEGYDKEYKLLKMINKNPFKLIFVTYELFADVNACGYASLHELITALAQKIQLQS